MPPAVFEPLQILLDICRIRDILGICRVSAIGGQEWLLKVAIVPF
jgi:hypothetical protein